MNARERLAWIERRGRGLRLFVERVAERGGHAETEEADLFVLRAEWLIARAALRASKRAA